MANGEEDKPLEMPEDDTTLSLEEDYPADEEPSGGGDTVNNRTAAEAYAFEPYVPVARPFSGEALITTGSKPLRIPVNIDTTSMRGIQLASNINSIVNSDRYSKADANALWDQLPVDTQDAITEIAKAQGGRSGRALWERSVNSSFLSTKQGAMQADARSPWEFIEEAAEKAAASGATGARTTGARGYSGPTQTITMASERDLRITADTIASEVLGRGVTDEEFQKVLKKVRTAEQSEPTVTTSGVGRTVTQSGLTAEGRQDIITRALMQGPEAEDFGKATKMMNLFYSALEARPAGA